ncbi:MAG: glycosyl hydrolase family 28-related protein [Candidatus Acidiferrales bacterium]
MRNSLRIIAFISLACIAASPAFAQGVRYNDIARTADNTPLNNGAVAVCVSNPTNPGNPGEPCSPLAAIYMDPGLSVPAANPILADTNGNFGFWAAPGTYFIEFYSPSRATVPFTQMITLACVANSTAAGCGSAATQSNNTWTGTNIFSSNALFKSGDPWFDVKAFGAKCDDVTDDTAAIQAALAAVPSTGGLVMIPGVCKFTSTLVISTPDVTIEGQGHFQFITQNAPVTYLDYQGANGNAILVSAQGFKMQDVGIKYPTTIGGPLAAPAAPTLTQVTGTGCPAEPYYAEITYLNAQGETSVSAEATLTTTAGNCLQVASPPAVTGATGWNLYVSTNPNNETKQNATPFPIGATWTFTGTLVNLGYRPPFNTTAYSAIYDNNGAQLDGVKIFTNAASSAGTASMANGYTGFGCCGKLHNVYIAGFGVGVAGAGSNNDFSLTDSFVQSNYVGAFIVNGADINIVRDDFEGNVVGNIKMLYGSPYTISQNYFEQQGTNPPSYNVQVGDTTIPPQGFTPTPGSMIIEGNFMQCNLTAYPPAPIVIDTAASLDIERNSFSQCGNQNIIANLAGTAAHIKVLGNISDAAPLSWITSTSGVDESDLSGTQLLPGAPFFYGLGVDSASGASSLLFRSAGASAWNMNASTSALSFGFNAHTGENVLQLKPFGSQNFASVQSNYAMDAAEVIVTQSGGAATFDAGLGNTFELTLTANVTSSTLVNVQPGQWLAFLICQGGSGGPFTFAWPSNVFGGGIIGSVGGNCSTQTFYVSSSNAWAVSPMMTNLSTGLSGLSLPAASGTVPYFTSAWTNGNCLQAGGSPGLITVTSSACGTGGSGGGSSVSINGSAISSLNFNGTTPAAGSGFANVTFQVSGSNVSAEVPTGSTPPSGANTAVQFNNSGAFGGDATNFFYNSSTHNLTITGALTTAANSFVLSQLANPAAQGDVLCGNSSPAWSDCAPGLQHRSVTGATDTIAATDRGNMVTYSGSSAVAVTLPAASSFGNNFFFHVESTSIGIPTFTPASGTINGLASFTPPENSFGTIYSPDNTNWTADFAFATSADGAATISATAPSSVGCNDTTVTVTGATTSMAVSVSPQASPGSTARSFTLAAGAHRGAENSKAPHRAMSLPAR